VGYEGEWEKFVERLARDLAPALKRRLYIAQLEKMRRLGPPSEKLVYLYLVLAEPQSYTGIKRSLALGGRTVDRTLMKLRVRGYIAQDEVFLYWVKGRVKDE